MSETANMENNRITWKAINNHSKAFKSFAEKQLPVRVAIKIAPFGIRLQECNQIFADLYQKKFKEYSGGKETMPTDSPEHQAFTKEIEEVLNSTSELEKCSAVTQEELLTACENKNLDLSIDEASCIYCFFAETH